LGRERAEGKKKPQGLPCGFFIVSPLSSEIARAAFSPLALFALSDIFNLSILEEGLHLDLTAATAHELVGADGSTSVLAGLCHGLFLRKGQFTEKGPYCQP
jgi:hypothetical protein